MSNPVRHMGAADRGAARGLRALLLALTLVLLAVVLIQCVVSQTPDPHWDIDPRAHVDASRRLLPTRDMGPQTIAWLHVASVGLAAAALAAHLAAGGRLRWGMVALAVAGAAPAVWHMHEHVDSLTHGAAWLAGFALALAAMHLAEHEQPRRWLVAGLLALLPALALQAAAYVFYEHRQTIAYFQENQSAMAAARSLLPGTSAYEQFVRRMQDWAAFGALGLSNVFGSIVMALTCLAMACAGSLWFRGWRGRAAMPAALAGMGLLALVLSRSRGAGLTLALVLVLLLVLGPRRLLGRGAAGRFVASASARRRVFLPLLLPLLVVSLVLVRGWMGPPQGHGSLSLYFRYLYWQGTLHMLLAQPARLLAGVGAGGFQDAFAHFKSAICPEDVASSHNVWIDDWAILGVGGLAWAVFLLACLRPAPATVKSPIPDQGEDRGQPFPQPRPAEMIPALTLTGLVFGFQALIQTDVMVSMQSFLPWATGAIAFLGLLSLLVSGQWLDGPALDGGLLLAATALLAHGQIEMTFYQPGACAIAMLVMGLAAGAPRRPTAGDWQRWGGGLAALLVLAAAIVMAAWYAIPVAQQQAALADGAQRLVDQDLDGTLRDLEAACAAVPTDPRIYRWRAWLELTRARSEHADNAVAREADFRNIGAILDAARRAGLDDNLLLRLRAQTSYEQWRLTGAAAALRDAQAAWQTLIRRSPYNPRSYLELALIELDLQRYAQAQADYAQALAVGNRLALDPAGPLTAVERQRFDDRWRAVAPVPPPQ
jgi:hypothetical protein